MIHNIDAVKLLQEHVPILQIGVTITAGIVINIEHQVSAQIEYILLQIKAKGITIPIRIAVDVEKKVKSIIKLSYFTKT